MYLSLLVTHNNRSNQDVGQKYNISNFHCKNLYKEKKI